MTAPELEAQSVVDPLLVAHLDEDWAVPCEGFWTHYSDPPPAEWILWWKCSCLPGHILFCTRCRDAVLADDSIIECDHCKVRWSPPASGVRLIEPLNRRTT